MRLTGECLRARLHFNIANTILVRLGNKTGEGRQLVRVPRQNQRPGFEQRQAKTLAYFKIFSMPVSYAFLFNRTGRRIKGKAARHGTAYHACADNSNIKILILAGMKGHGLFLKRPRRSRAL
jgi:hypothetical protein